MRWRSNTGRACGNREDAEDVLVDALVKAHRHLGQLRNARAFRSWLAQIARRVCWQLKRREALQPLLHLSVMEEEGREIPSGERPLEQQIALRQMSSLLHEAVDKLSEEYRSVYVWRDLEDVPAKEVAKRLGISLAAVKSRLHRARESVRNELDAALIQQPGATKLVSKKAGVSPKQGGDPHHPQHTAAFANDHAGCEARGGCREVTPSRVRMIT